MRISRHALATMMVRAHGEASANTDPQLISDAGLSGLWRLAEDPDRLSPAERALLALALSELVARRSTDTDE